MPSFADPWFLLLLPLVPLVVWWRWRRKQPALRLSDARLLTSLPAGRSKFIRRLDGIIYGLATLCLVLALAGPRLPLPTPITTEGIAIALVVDGSGSMYEPDFEWDSKPATRIHAVQEVFQLLVLGGQAPGEVSFPGRPQDLIGLVTFASYPDTAAPLTTSHSVLMKLLTQEPPRQPDEGQTNVGDAIAEALTCLEAAGPRRKVMVLMTDGEHNFTGPATAPTWKPRPAAQRQGSRRADLHDRRRRRRAIDRSGRPRRGPRKPEGDRGADRRRLLPRSRRRRSSSRLQIDRSTRAAADRNLAISPLSRSSELVRSRRLRVHRVRQPARGDSREAAAMNKVPSIFAHPWVLSLLFVMPALTIVQLLAAWRNRRLLRKLGDLLTLLSQLPTPRRFTWLSAFLFGLGITALLMGAAGPRWGQDEKPSVVPGRDLVVLLDMSNSMRATDAPPDRFHRAVAAVKSIADYCRHRGGHRLALVVFAADAQVICPLTQDYNHFENKLEALDMDDAPAMLRPRSAAQSGTRIGAGLRAAIAAHDLGRTDFQDVLLISDGDDPVNDGEWEFAAREIATTGIPVYAVGVGDPNRGADIPIPGRAGKVHTRLIEKPLQEISRRTAGSYLLAGVEMPRLDEFFRQRIESKGGSIPEGDALPLPHSRHAWFYAAALIFFGLAALVRFRFSDLDIQWRKREVES